MRVQRAAPITLTRVASLRDLSRVAREVCCGRHARACLVPLLLLVLWWLGTRGNPDGLIPPPAAVGVALWDLAFGGINDDAFSQMLLTDLIASASRVYGAFLLAAAVALPLGMLIGRLPIVRDLLEPSLQLLRPVPVTAWLPLSMIIFGLGPRSAFFLVALGAFYPILVNTVFAVRSVEPRLFEAAQMLGVSPARLFPKVVLPASLPGMFTGLRVGLGFAWVVIVVGEMTGVQTGLGAMIMDARQLSRTEIVISGMAVIGLAGFLSDLAIQLLGRRLLAWSPLHG
ncbi:MAG: ABC transporter permease [Acetobacteraceae bacterium]